MSQRKAEPAIQAVRRYLEQERQFLAEGRFTELEALVAKKEDAIGRLRAAQIGSELLADLRSEAAKNQVLLDAAQKGVRAAIDRIEAIQSARAGLSTYDQTGRRIMGEGARTGVKRQA